VLLALLSLYFPASSSSAGDAVPPPPEAMRQLAARRQRKQHAQFLDLLLTAGQITPEEYRILSTTRN
jgi:hypothetical protein